mmetsp:Transcript_20045/g.17732  ORF Transcript_20045/g.17732 Transcript_20045/m.17732 type:complete len:105 (-) Transcript_20045:406-720(-)
MYQKLAEMQPDKEATTQIHKDLHRTNAKEMSEENVETLKNILYAYANMDPEVGYSQGMNFLVFTMMKNIDDEELVFWCLYDIMYNKNWRLILKDKTPKFLELVK